MSFEYIPFGQIFSEPQRNGLTRPKKIRGSGLPMINMGELFSYPRIKNIKMDLVPVTDSESQYHLKDGDLLFARQSLVLAGAGQCSIFLGNQQQTVFESHLIRCRLDKDVANPLYYFYFFRSPQGRRLIETIVEQGAGASGIRGSDLVKLNVPKPSKDVQEGIAAMLGSLDDRITLLHETNKTLESIAQAIFKSWFVDFDPVRAKMEGRQPEGMDEATAALFPDSFEESELGLVPKGWSLKPLATAYEINPLRRLQRGAVATYLEMSNAPIQGLSVQGTAKRAFGSGTKFINGDTLLARITPCLENGKTAFVDFLSDAETGWGSTEFIVLRPRLPLPPLHAYLLCRDSRFRSHAIQSMSGTSGRQRVQSDVLSQFIISVPCGAVAKQFSDLCDAIHQKISKNHDLSITLSTLRDTLLPRLISGQLRLPEAQAQIENALT